MKNQNNKPETSRACGQSTATCSIAYQRRVVIGDCILYLGDCLDVMPEVGLVDAVITDMPYGTTACKWDTVVDLDKLWQVYPNVVDDNAPIVLTATQPFTSALVMSNPNDFKYEWIYEKTNPKGFLSAAHRPLTAHESVLVFSKGKAPYFPQKWKVPEYLRTRRKHATSHTAGECYGGKNIKRWDDDGSRFPVSVIGFSNRVGRNGNFHPTQKPVSLMEYLVRTYTEPGDIVLDHCMGSATTGVACKRTGRKFIGIEKDKAVFETAIKRVSDEYKQMMLF